MRPNHNYWTTREYKQREELYKKTVAEIEARLRKQYDKTARLLIKELTDVYEKLQSGESKAVVSDMYKFDKYYETINRITKELTKLGIKEQIILEKKFSDMYVSNVDIVGRSYGFHIAPSQEQINMAVNSIWCNDGLNFSQRIWKDKEQLTERLKQGLFDCIQTGRSSAELKKELMIRFNQSYSNADRLVRTELSHIENKAAIDSFANAGVKKYEVLAELDERTCEICEEMDGKIFPIDDLRIPFHCRCRCTVLAVLEEE